MNANLPSSRSRALEVIGRPFGERFGLPAGLALHGWWRTRRDWAGVPTRRAGWPSTSRLRGGSAPAEAMGRPRRPRWSWSPLPWAGG
jgi:hypothetical protein